IVYDNGGGTSIGISGGGTLTQGGTYLAVVDPTQPTRLGLEDPSGHPDTQANPRPAPNSLGSHQLLTANFDFNLGRDPVTIDLRGEAFTSFIYTTNNLIDLGSSPTRRSSDLIVYDNGGGTSIGISGGVTLTQGGTYLAVVDPNHPTWLGLEDTSG